MRLSPNDLRLAQQFHRQAIRGDHLDGREPPFGLVVPFNNSAAFRWIASSASSSRMRRRAAANSARSAGVRPGSIPWSTRSCRRQPYTRLFADAEIDRDVARTPASGDQVKGSLPKLRRIPVCPCCPPGGTAACQSRNPTPRNPGLTKSPGFPGRFTRVSFRRGKTTM